MKLKIEEKENLMKKNLIFFRLSRFFKKFIGISLVPSIDTVKYVPVTRAQDTQHNDTQHKDTQHNDTQHNVSITTLSITTLSITTLTITTYGIMGCIQNIDSIIF